MFKLFKKKDQSLNKDIETDVLIIGHNLSGVITSFKLLNNHVESIIIDSSFNNHFTNLTCGENYELNGLNLEDKMEAFKNVLGTVYELDDLNKKLKNKIDYKRSPNISYKPSNVENGLQLFTGIFYDFGIKINKYKLFKRLTSYLEHKKVKMYKDTEVVFYCVDNQNIVVMTNSGYKIKCKKVVNTLNNKNLYAKTDMINKDYIVNNYYSNDNILDNLLSANQVIDKYLGIKLNQKSV